MREERRGEGGGGAAAVQERKRRPNFYSVVAAYLSCFVPGREGDDDVVVFLPAASASAPW